MNPILPSNVGAVVIGRNEGPRLDLALSSVLSQINHVVYVDSDSSDNSLEIAKRKQVTIVQLDPSTPLSAARARNEGFRKLVEMAPDIEFVQFIDGDCEISEGWIEAAQSVFHDSSVAIVAGQLKELHPTDTIYNLMCSIEWDTPPGVSKSVGGIFLVRKAAFEEVNGFELGIIAAEDDEFCLRLRKNEYIIMRTESTMAFHDANVWHFSQWWRRAKRSGHGFAQVYSIHGGPPFYHFRKELIRTVFWGFLLPVFAILLTFNTHGLSLIIAIGLYLLSFMRVFWSRLKRNGIKSAFAYATFTTFSKFPAFLGACTYWIRRARRMPYTILEYKRTCK